jgi:hypothetical protein
VRRRFGRNLAAAHAKRGSHKHLVFLLHALARIRFRLARPLPCLCDDLFLKPPQNLAGVDSNRKVIITLDLYAHLDTAMQEDATAIDAAFQRRK